MRHVSVVDWRYGFSIWYTDSGAGGRLRDMQYAWSVFNIVCGIWCMKIVIGWKEAVSSSSSGISINRDRQVFYTRVGVAASYFTWAFGVWTTAVLFYSFKG